MAAVRGRAGGGRVGQARRRMRGCSGALGMQGELHADSADVMGKVEG